MTKVNHSLAPFAAAVVVVAAFISISIPVAANAAWWNPFTWSSSKNVASGISTSNTTLSAIDQLENRIAELEQELNAALAKIPTTTPAAPVVAKVVAPAPASAATTNQINQNSGLSNNQLMAKAGPAIVFLQTATSSGSGVVIDSSGYILTNAHTVWSEDPTGAVVGVANQVAVTLSTGAQKQATLVGIDETDDLAVLQISGGGTFPYLKLNYEAGLGKGQSTYIFSLPMSNGGSTGGSKFVSGTISQMNTSSITMTANSKPFDTGGAMVNDAGGFIGVPKNSSCKIVEDMSNCLEYTITANDIHTIVPKLLAGMQLYKNKANETLEEATIRGELGGMYQSFSQSGVIDFAVNSVSDDNSFDYFNGKLGGDTDGKIAKLYVLKLKQIAQNMYQAVDFFKSQSYDLNVFLLGEAAPITHLGSYERQTLAKIQSANALKVQEYQDKVAYWSKKKNEYDSYITDPSKVTHDYLMAEGAAEESEVNYLTTERQRILNVFSGESVNIF